jgi:thiamine biosynthesis lipoprotein
MVAPAARLTEARDLVRQEMHAVDLAASRFRPDSELARLHRAGPGPRPVGPLLFEAVSIALDVAERTGGAVDPTVGQALLDLGYDRDYDEVAAAPPTTPLAGAPGPAPGWTAVSLDPDRRTIELPPGLRLDLGATAKALCADRAARRVAEHTGAGVVVDIGGDLAVAGPVPPEGWAVGIVESARRPGPADVVVAVTGGGMASSGTTVRTWQRSGWPLHHIVDPATGWPVPPVWALVTVAAGSCVEANALSTAAVVWGPDAPFRVAQLGLPARFVAVDGAVIEVGGWPRPGPTGDR